MAGPKPRDPAAECRENIEREILGYCTYLAIVKRAVVAIGKNNRDKEQAILGYKQELKALHKFSLKLLAELRQAKLHNLALEFGEEELAGSLSDELGEVVP